MKKSSPPDNRSDLRVHRSPLHSAAAWTGRDGTNATELRRTKAQAKATRAKALNVNLDRLALSIWQELCPSSKERKECW